MAENTVAKSETTSSQGASGMGSFMNTTTIHIIAEIIAICGMGVYFHTRMNKLAKQNQELLERLEEQDEAINKHEELLEKIVARMNRDNGVVNTQPKKTQKPARQAPQPQDDQEPEPVLPSPMSLIADIMSVTAGKFGPPQAAPQPAPMPSIQELDSELEKELQDLKEDKKE